MKIYVHDAGQNPHAESWSPRELDEATTTRLFHRLVVPKSFITIQIRDDVSTSVIVETDDKWELDITFSQARKGRSGTFGREVALSFVIAAFHGDEAEALAERLQMSWYDIPPDPGFTAFHPGRSRLRADGVIIIPAGGHAPGGGIWDGHVLVECSHPNYRLWLWIRTLPKYQEEDATITDQDLETLRKEFTESLPDELRA